MACRRWLASERRRMGAWAVVLLGVLVVLSTAVAEEDPEAPEVTDCEVPHNESRADQCLFINDEANNVRHPTDPSLRPAGDAWFSDCSLHHMGPCCVSASSRRSFHISRHITAGEAARNG